VNRIFILKAANLLVGVMLIHPFVCGYNAAAQSPRRIVLSEGTTFLTIDQDRAWLWNQASRSIEQIDLSMGRISERTIPLDFEPLTASFEDGSLWICSKNRSVLARVDISTYKLVALIDISQYFQAEELVSIVTGEGTVWLKGEERVVQIDPKINQVYGQPIGAGEEIIVAVVAEGHLWTGSHDDGLVTRIDTKTNRIIAQFEVGFSVHGLAVNHDSAWILDEHGFAVVQVNPDTNMESYRVPIDFVASNITLAQDGSLWIAPAAYDGGKPTDNDVFVRIDTTKKLVAEKIHVGAINKRLEDAYYQGLTDSEAVWAIIIDKPTTLVNLTR
jgi:streptogramin lyase